MKTDIFSNGTADSGQFVSFKKVGDSIQGTYVDIREGKDSFGNDQYIYVLKDSEGKMWNVGVKRSTTIMVERMKQIRFGQIIGFRLDELRPSKTNPAIPAKIIRIYADEKIMDTEWISRKKALEEQYRTVEIHGGEDDGPEEEYNAGDDFNAWGKEDESSEGATALTQNIPHTKTPMQTEALDAARKLAISKGIANEGDSITVIDALIKKVTGLDVTEENVNAIIVRLATFKV